MVFWKKCITAWFINICTISCHFNFSLRGCIVRVVKSKKNLLPSNVLLHADATVNCSSFGVPSQTSLLTFSGLHQRLHPLRIILHLCALVQVVIGREKQHANSQLIASPTRVPLAERATAQQTGRRLSDVWLPRYLRSHMHTRVKQ